MSRFEASPERMKKQRDKVPSKLPAFLNALLFSIVSRPLLGPIDQHYCVRGSPLVVNTGNIVLEKRGSNSCPINLCIARKLAMFPE